ncbi:MAG: TaqI-like C-terminal specificity domain-containing protein, partial [Fidelibacterota bacterium]
FTFDEAKLYGDTTVYIIPSDSKYLLGVLNSKLWTFIFSKISSEIRGGYYRWKRQYMSPLPIRPINFNNPADKSRHDKMGKLVDRMLDLHNQLAKANAPHDREVLRRQIDATDKQIDRLVYELYGLTEEEIGIVEGRTNVRIAD